MIKLNSSYFNWLTWRNGSIISILKIPHRKVSLIENKSIIRKYAIGYCDASRIPCRPKYNHVAVMFNTSNDYDWWTHLTREEFSIIFPEVNKESNYEMPTL